MMAETTKKASTTRKPRAAKPKAVAEAAVTTKPNTAAKRTVKAKKITASSEQVAELAHRFWVESGRRHGQHEEHWFRAEQELYQKAS
jgi:hypothetical protein